MAFDVAGFKQFFFDRAAVVNAADAKVRQGLAGFGAFTRQVARNLLKYGKASAAPGSPPLVHRSGSFTRTRVNKTTGAVKSQPSSPLKELIFFGYDRTRKSAVVGAALGGPASGVPALMEHGGSAVVTSGSRKGRTGHYAPRPFIGPAAQKGLERFKALIRG